MSQNTKIVNSWTLVSFAAEFGSKVSIAPFTNKETGEKFKSLAFKKARDDKKSTLVGFSKNLGELSAAELKAQRDILQVVELPSTINEDGDKQRHFKLCKQGAGWEEVDLFD